jgi:hypothetical protein
MTARAKAQQVVFVVEQLRIAAMFHFVMHFIRKPNDTASKAVLAERMPGQPADPITLPPPVVSLPGRAGSFALLKLSRFTFGFCDVPEFSGFFWHD